MIAAPSRRRKRRAVEPKSLSAAAPASDSPADVEAAPPSQQRAQRILAQTIEYICNASAAVQPAATAPTEAVPAEAVSAEAAAAAEPPPLIGMESPISPEEEATLFRRMNDLKRRAERLRSKLSADSPSETLMDEIDWLLSRASRIRNRLANLYLRLVISIARRFIDAENPLEDLVSEGNSTLLRAVEKFDVERGFRFSTYATHAIRRNLCRYVTNRRKLRQREASSETLDMAPEERRWTLAEEKQIAQAYTSVSKMIDRLSDREQLIIRSRFGLHGEAESVTLQQLADDLGVSRERVRQLEQRALTKLRGMAEAAHIEAPCL